MNEQKTWLHDEAIRSQAEKFVKENDLTQTQFTGKLAGNFSTTRVAKYLNLDKEGSKPEPDAPKVEAAIRAFLRHVARGLHLQASLYDNSLTREVAGVLRQIRRTGDIGLIRSDAGEGKTCSAILFCRDNPDTLFVTAKYPYGCSEWALMKMVFNEFSASIPRQWDGKMDRWHWLEKELLGTERLLVIDDAELLFMSAFRWAFSLHDATGMPMAFIGNNEVITKIQAADSSGKMISRIGIVHHAHVKNDEADAAQRLVRQFAPESGDELVDDVTRTICEFGHSRRARKQLALTVNARDGGREKDWRKVYANAGTKLIGGAQNGRGR
jgi:DNA transposition AAA+ family ATPase